MVGVVVGRQCFGGSGGEVGDDGVDGDAGACDQDAGLPGGAVLRIDAPPAHLLGDRKGRVLLADGAIRAHGEQTPCPSASRLLPVWKSAIRVADVE